MATAYSSRLRLAKPTTGELNNTWGDVVNQNLTDMVDQAIAGVAAVTLPDSNYSLTVNNGTSDESRPAVLVFSGALTAARTVTTPAVSKVYAVRNATTGGFAINMSAGGVALSVPNGQTLFCYTNGTDFFEVGRSLFTALTVSALTATLAADMSAAGFKVTNLAAPTNNGDAATKAYVDGTAFSPALPGQAGQAGKVVRTDGTTATWQEPWGTPVNLDVSDTGATLTARTAYHVDSSGGAITLNLPAAGADMWVLIRDVGLMNATNNVTLVPNGTDTVYGSAQNWVMNVNGEGLLLVQDTLEGWVRG